MDDIDKHILRNAKINKLLQLENTTRLLYITGIHSKDKRVRICNYLMHQLKPNCTAIMFSKRILAKKFNCSNMTVSRAINAMKNAKNLQVDGNIIRLVSGEGDKQHEK